MVFKRINSLVQLTSLLLLTTSFSFQLQAKSQLPDNFNIVMIVIDDLGWMDLGFMGSKYFETPNIDQLASEGAVFEQAYAGAANCAPARACLMTSRNTPTHNIFTVSPSTRGHEKTRKIIPTVNQDTLPKSLPNIPKYLKKQGYKTAHFGKWHLSEDPVDYGFEYNIGGCHSGNPGSYFRPFTRVENMPEGPEGEYLTERITKEVLDYLEKNRSEKFFVYLPYYTVHTPLQPHPETYERWKNKPTLLHEAQAKYAAMVSYMDSQIGSIVNHLEKLKIRENTLIIFTSDNGGITSISPQTPLRAGKGSYYEGGTRVPLIFNFPGYIKPQSDRESLISQMDIFPTLQSLLSNVISDDFEGQSLENLLFESKTRKWIDRDLIWYFPIYLQAYRPLTDESRDPLFRTRPGMTIRSGDWKLHYYFEDGEVELYDLAKDLSERNNLAEIKPEKTKELVQKLMDWCKRQKVPTEFDENPRYDAEFEKSKIASL